KWCRPWRCRRSRAVLPPRLRRDDRSAHSAFRLGPVDAKRVELGELMQKSPGRRRYRDERARISEQDRLSQLTIPGPETEPGAFVAGELELVAAEKGRDRTRIGRLRPRRCFTDRPHCHPGSIIAVGHPALCLAQKAFLQ